MEMSGKVWKIAFVIILAASFLASFIYGTMAKGNNAGSGIEATSDRSSAQSSSNEFDVFYTWIGNVKEFKFLDCCTEHNDIVRHEIDNLGSSTNIKYIEYDFNKDGLLDFVARIEDEVFCEYVTVSSITFSICPIFLFVKEGDFSYQKYEGLPTRGDDLAVVEANVDGVHDIVYRGNGPGRCVWKWSLPRDKGFTCVMGTSIQKEDRKIPSTQKEIQ